MEGIVVKEPWVVLESSKFAGRFYYFNMESKTTAWSLHPSYIIENPSTSSKHNATKHSSDAPSELPRIVKSPTGGGSSNGKIFGPSMTAPMKGALPSVQGKGSGQRSQRRRSFVSSRPKKDSFDAIESMLADPAGRLPLRVAEGLGQGGYGVVVKVEHKYTKLCFAMKAVSKEKLRRRRDRERLALELKIMELIGPSPFCQQFYQSFETKTSVFILMELQGGGDLFFHLMDRIATYGTAFPEGEVRVLMAELILALEHVHKEGFVHRDIKVENVMLDSVGHIKLIDYGLAVELVEEVMPMSATGSLIYMAPEMISEQTGGRHTDWWALGVLMFELLTGSSPWSSIDDKPALKEDIKNQRVAPPEGLSRSTAQLIERLLRKDFRHRIGTNADAELKEAPFFSSIDWEQTASVRSPPAFSPAPISVCPEEAASAAEMYYELARVDEEATSHDCSMGLRVAGGFPGL